MIALMSVMAFLPVVLEERGIVEDGGRYVSIIFMVSFVAKLIGGAVSDKIGKRKIFLVCGMFIAGLCLPGFLIFAGIPLITFLVLSGIGTGPIVPIMLTATVLGLSWLYYKVEFAVKTTTGGFWLSFL